MTPCRTEKVDFSKKKKNHQNNNSTGRVTRKIKKKRKNNKKTKQNQTIKKTHKKNQNLHFPQFFLFLLSACCFLFLFFSWFFLGFGFLVCFFCLLCFVLFYFFVKPYILCVTGLITIVIYNFIRLKTMRFLIISYYRLYIPSYIYTYIHICRVSINGNSQWLDGLFRGKSQTKIDEGTGYPMDKKPSYIIIYDHLIFISNYFLSLSM